MGLKAQSSLSPMDRHCRRLSFRCPEVLVLFTRAPALRIWDTEIGLEVNERARLLPAPCLSLPPMGRMARHMGFLGPQIFHLLAKTRTRLQRSVDYMISC